MYILVAVTARKPYFPEAPFFLLFVTFKTGCGLVCAPEWKGTPAVLVRAECGLCKSSHLVTMRTIRRNPVFCKLIVVIISVTIYTTIMFQRIGKIYLVAGFAVYILVFPLQPESCFVMIEFFNSLYNLKRYLTVTLPAVLAELVLVRIFMAIGTIAVLNVSEMLEFFSIDRLNFMAFKTLD